MPKVNSVKKSSHKDKLMLGNPGDFNTEIGQECEKDNRDLKGGGEGSVTDKYDGCEDLDVLVAKLSSAAATKKSQNDTKSQNFLISAMTDFKEFLKKQEEERKRLYSSVQRSLATLVAQMETDDGAIQENNQQLQQLFRAQFKLSQQTQTAHHQRLQAIREIQQNSSKLIQDVENKQHEEVARAQDDLVTKVQEMQRKLIAEQRRKSADALRKACSSML